MAPKGRRPKVSQVSEALQNRKRARSPLASPFAVGEPKEDLSIVPVSTDSININDKRRRLSRRDSDEQVNRVIEEKLTPNYREELIEAALTKKGMKIRPYIKTALVGLTVSVRGNKARLSTKFWTQFYADFPTLSLGISAYLPDPPADLEEVRDELQAALATAYDPNPSSRTPVHVERVLENLTKDLNETELFGLVQAVEESPTISRPHSEKMKMAIMLYLARTSFSKNLSFTRCKQTFGTPPPHLIFVCIFEN
jgi:hypothetical protein